MFFGRGRNPDSEIAGAGMLIGIMILLSTPVFSADWPDSDLKYRQEMKIDRSITGDDISLSGITVDITDVIKDVNYSVIGSAISGQPISWSPSTLRHNSSHLTGLGVWDTINNDSVKEVVAYARDMGIRYLRFPGGTGEYRWQHAVGPVGKRPRIYWSGKFSGDKKINFDKAVTFGLPEFLKFSRDAGAHPVILLSEFPEKFSVQSAAELVNYLNGPCDGTCTTAIDDLNYDTVCVNSDIYVKDDEDNVSSSDWAQVRVCDKYVLRMSNIEEPWNVRWFEYGNESYGDYPEDPDTYINNYLQYQAAMKEIDPDVMLGAVLAGNYHSWPHHRRWVMAVIPALSDMADFYIIHKYIPRFSGCCRAKDLKCQKKHENYMKCTSAENLFTIGLAGVNGQLDNEYQELNALIYDITGSHVPIAVTEYNGSYNEAEYDYFESLGNALVNAEHIKQLMFADNIMFATHHHFNNSNAGVLKGGAAPYVPRPVYYAFQLYNNHFGTKLLNAEVISGNYQYTNDDPYYDKYYWVEPAYGEHKYEQLLGDSLSGKEWIIDSPQPDGLSNVNNAGGVLTIDLNRTADVDYHHAGKETRLQPDTWYRVSGLIKTEKLEGTHGEGVYLAVKSGRIDNLVVNPGFESWNGRADDWTYSNPDYVLLDSNVKHSGNNSFKLHFSGDDPDLAYSQRVSVEPNTDYIIEGYVKADLSTNGRGVRIDVKDTRSWECGYWGTPEIRNTRDRWVHIYQAIHTSSPDKIAKNNGSDCSAYDTNEVSVMLVRQKGGTIRGSAWWDDVKLSIMNTSKKKRYMLEGTTSWRYIEFDFRTKSKPDNPDGTVHARVYITRNSGGFNVGGTIKVKDLKLRELEPGNHGSVPYLSVNASKNDDGSKVYLMVVNKHMHNDITTPITLNAFNPRQAEAWTLNADSVDATIETGVINGGFEGEGDYNNWIINDPPGVVTTIDNTNSFSGHKSAKIVFKGTHDVEYTQTHTSHSIKVKPVTAYRLEGYIKTEKLTTNSGLTLIARDGHGKKYGEWTATPVLTGTNEWTYVSTDFTTGPETSHISVRLKRIAAGLFRGKISGTVWVDHIVLKELNVKMTQSIIAPVANGFKFTFPAHSLTALEISGISGSD